MSKYSVFLKIFFLISIYGCGYNQVTSKPEIYSSVSITFDKSIPIPMVAKLKSTFDTNADLDAISVSIKNYSMKKYNVYGGNALRALEGELTLKTQIMIQSATKSSNKYLSSMKRYKSNELNPYAEDDMIKLLESEMQREILNKILIEVNFFEM
jgi:hypothetical protein